MSARSLLSPTATASIVKHAVHDQTDHGNWARGGYGQTKVQRITDGELAEHNSDNYQRYKFPDDDKIYTIEVTDNPHGGHAWFHEWGKEDSPLGRLSWHDDGVIAMVSVETTWQRRGIATELLKMARQVHPNVRHSENLSFSAERWAEVAKHWGPGPHPGTGTPQSIHAPGGGLNTEAADKLFTDALGPLIEEFGAPSEFTYAAGVSPVAYEWFNEIYAKLQADEDLLAKYEPALDKWWDTQRAIREDVERDLYIRLAKGEISVEEATNLGLSEYSQEIRDIGELPPVVYHATTDTASVLEHGLKARDELGQSRGLGLGGGTANTISFTDSKETALGILRGMRERHAVLNDPATHLPRLIEEAKEAKWWDNKMEMKWGSGQESASAETLSQGGVYGLLKGEATYVASGGQSTVEDLRAYMADASYYKDKYDLDTIELITPKSPKNMWEKAIFRVKYTPQGHAEAIGDFMDEYALYRESAGGPLDPLFISNDDYAFAQKDIEDFSVIVGKTKPGTRGYKLSSMSEWRTWTGEVLESMEAVR